MMGFSEKFYDLMLFPLEKLRLSKQRNQLLKNLKGTILEIGAGTGVNLKFYQFNNIQKIDLVDLELTKTLKEYSFPKTLNITLHESSVEKLPFQNNSFDYVVFTLVFCSVSNPQKGLEEIKRVLKPGGKIIFIEHVLPLHDPYKKLFHTLTPTWEKMAHGCHLNRETLTDIKLAGFSIEKYSRFFKGAFISGVGILNSEL